MPNAKRALIYARVSTSHHDQKPEVQTEELKRYCEARGWQIVEEIIDHGYSGSNSNRPGFKKLMKLARSRKIDIVVTTKLDRLFRSLKDIVLTLQEFTELGVDYVSTLDQIDMTSSIGRLHLHIISAFSEFELSLIRERTIQGMEHARRMGKRIGRPPAGLDNEIMELRNKGLSYRKIVKELGCSMGVVTRAIKSSKQAAPKGVQKEVTND
jgi:DNA invertase Pin-like site-specific DNA recombinase